MSKPVWAGVLAGAVVVLGLGAYSFFQSPVATEAGRTDNSALNRAASDSSVPSVGQQPTGSTPGLVTPGAVVPGETVAPSATPGGLLPGQSAATPPWAAASGARTPATGSAPLSPPAVGRSGAPSMDDIQRRLQGLVANGRQPSAREVDSILADLQRNQGSDVVAGVNLQTLRDNLGRAERMQQIALEVQAIAANPRKEDQARLQSLTSELQRLQAGMAPNVAQPAKR